LGGWGGGGDTKRSFLKYDVGTLQALLGSMIDCFYNFLIASCQ